MRLLAVCEEEHQMTPQWCCGRVRREPGVMWTM